MAIIRTITASEFTSAFHNMGRGGQFSHKGLLSLFNYLENMSEETGSDIELDVVALCCEYYEYTDVWEFLEDYNIGIETEELDEDEILDEIRDYLNENTSYIVCKDDCILFAAF